MVRAAPGLWFAAMLAWLASSVTIQAQSNCSFRTCGIYVQSGWLSQSPERVLQSIRATGANAVVVDVASAEQTQTDGSADNLQSTRLWIRRFHRANLRVVGRLTCFFHPKLARAHPSRALDRSRRWLNPAHPANVARLRKLTRRAQAAGFDELQLDYFRYPPARAEAALPSAEERQAALSSALRAVHDSGSIPVGVTLVDWVALGEQGPGVVGQEGFAQWSRWVDVWSPMLYVHAASKWMRSKPAPESLIARAMARMREKLGAKAIIRPYLQAFPKSVPHYGPSFVARQLRAVREAGVEGALFWNVRSEYDALRKARGAWSTEQRKSLND